MNNFIFWKISSFFFHLIGERDEEKVYLNEMDWPSLKDLREPCSFKTEQRVYRRSDFLCPQPLILNSFKNWESTKWALFWYIMNFTDVTKWHSWYKGCQKIIKYNIDIRKKGSFTPVTSDGKSLCPKVWRSEVIMQGHNLSAPIPQKLTV